MIQRRQILELLLLQSRPNHLFLEYNSTFLHFPNLAVTKNWFFWRETLQPTAARKQENERAEIVM